MARAPGLRAFARDLDAVRANQPARGVVDYLRRNGSLSATQLEGIIGRWNLQ